MGRQKKFAGSCVSLCVCPSISGNSARTAGPIGTGVAPMDAPERRWCRSRVGWRHVPPRESLNLKIDIINWDYRLSSKQMWDSFLNHPVLLHARNRKLHPWPWFDIMQSSSCVLFLKWFPLYLFVRCRELSSIRRCLWMECSRFGV